MSFNRNATRRSGRYNTQGRIVPPTQQPTNTPQVKTFNIGSQESLQNGADKHINNQQAAAPTPAADRTAVCKVEAVEDGDTQHTDKDMETSADDQPMETDASEAASKRPHWMKPKLPGVRKISNKERRRRQNQTLRRLLTPKNALMVLNEIDGTGANNFTVQPTHTSGQYFKANNSNSFCAALNTNGNEYKGYGENKLTARNAAAEQAVRDLLLKKMTAVLNTDAESPAPAEGDVVDGPMEEDLPMIQLASFALYKLFYEWECQGHRVPQMRSPNGATPEGGSEAGSSGTPTGQALPGPKRKEPRSVLPTESASMHPCMLLSHMRPGSVYREVAVEGDSPQNFVFTMEVEVDGVSYTGRASSKREARKAAARAACQGMFNARFNDDPK